MRRAVERIHAGQFDKRGKPYIGHLIAVAAGVSERAKIVALFHDSIEDQHLTIPDLRRIGLTSTEILAVRLLTRPEKFSYDAYIARLAIRDDAAGALAREVKISDLRHNLGRLIPELEYLRPRYERALALLS